jgi:fatty acid desaturase
MPEPHGATAVSFSANDARPLVADLFTPNPLIYWADLLASALGGHVCVFLVWVLPFLLPGTPWLLWPLRAVAFAGSVLLSYRAAMFTHELAHLKRGTFRAFRCAWNLLVGIPMLFPSFLYHPHAEHHRRSHYGTPGDGEYLPLAHSPPWRILAYFLRPFVLPLLLVARFALLAPLAWLLPPFRRWVYRRASSVMVNTTYHRPPPPRGGLLVLRVQEALCFCWCVAVPVLPLVFLHRLPVPFLVQGYLTAVCALFLSSFRTLGAHRWNSRGGPMTLEEQLLDSVNYPHWPLLGELWGPVGLRYHALHHVFPTLPYHALPEAHRRLMRHLPADSPYRRTEEGTLLGAIGALWRRAEDSTRAATERAAERVS